MKKQFFYAAMALAVMSSCSKDNDPGIGNPEENNDKAVIALDSMYLLSQPAPEVQVRWATLPVPKTHGTAKSCTSTWWIEKPD